MKKFNLILGALLVSMSVLAGPLGNFRTSVRTQDNKQEDCRKVATTSPVEKFVATPAIQVMDTKSVTRFNRMPQRKAAAQSVIKAEEVGYGNASIEITPADGADTLYYQLAILDQEYNILAALSYFKLSMLSANIESTYDLIQTAAKLGSSKGGYISSSITSLYLPKGGYIVALLGFPVVGNQLAEEPADVAMAQFAITMDGTEYAIKNIQATLGENNKLAITWENAAAQLPEGTTYQVRIFALPYDTVAANSGYELTEAAWTTPDTISLASNASYEIYVQVWAASGYALGKAGSLYYVIGTDPNAPTDLQVSVDEETMKATLTWKNSITQFQVDDTTTYKVYNEVILLDAQGKRYIFDNGYNNTSAETALTEALPVGNYTWKVVPFYADEAARERIAVVNGPDFEVVDKVAPVIDTVYLANVSDTEVNLAIDAHDNAVGVSEADLTYDVTGDITLTGAKLEADGTLKLSELTSKLYKINITAADPSGNKSEAYPFEFTPVKDDQAPTDLKAELDSVSDKFINVKVSAKDNIATAEQLVYVFIFDENTRFEASAKDGNILINGLKPETEYSVKVTVKDFGGNVSKDTVVLNFKTLELIPIELEVSYAQMAYQAEYSQEGAQNFEFLLAELNATGSALELPEVYFDLYMPTKTNFAGTYNAENGNLDEKYSGYLLVGDSKAKKMTNAELTLKFIYAEEEDGVKYSMYNIYVEFMDEAQENLYIIDGNFWVYIWMAQTTRGTSTDVFVDDDAPIIDVNPEYPVEAAGTSAEIMFLAYDGPYTRVRFVDETGAVTQVVTDPVYTEITDLKLEIQLEDGTVLASQAEGSIENTPTLDEDGAYYFTATVSNLEPNTDYVVYIYAEDKAGNVAERLKVEFNSGEEEQQGIENVNDETNVRKFMREGTMIIERNKVQYTPQGQVIRK